MSALAQARSFNANTMQARLFPSGWSGPERSVPVAGAAALSGGLLLFGLGIGGLVMAELLAPGTLAMAFRQAQSMAGRGWRTARRFGR